MSPPILASSLTRGKVTTPNMVDSGITLCASSWSVMVVASVVLRLAAERLFSGLPELRARRLLPSSIAPSSMSILTSRGLSGDILSASKGHKEICWITVIMQRVEPCNGLTCDKRPAMDQRSLMHSVWRSRKRDGKNGKGMERTVLTQKKIKLKY